MKADVQQYHVDKQCFEIQKKQFLIENDRLLDQIISQDIVNIVVNSSVDVNTSVKVNSSVIMNDSVNYVEMCNKCLELKAELIKQHNMLIQQFLGYVRDSCPDIHKPRVNPSTSASISEPSGNTKNDRILRTPSSNEKNKVEVQSRKVKSSLNKRNSDSKNVYNEHVKHLLKGAKALCSVCNECLFDANHAMCLIDHMNSMNVRAKSVSKKNKTS
ncbi:hypothetical protein Tco_1353305 [Tanacetum coccineum]